MVQYFQDGITVTELIALLQKIPPVRPDGQPSMVLIENNGYGLSDLGSIAEHSETFSHMPDGNVYLGAD